MRRIALLILLWHFFVCADLWAQSAENLQSGVHDAKVNIGVKAGFNSSMFFIDEFKLGDYSLDHIQNNYKVGYFASFFVRFNLKKHHFLQTEASYHIAKGSISINQTTENIYFLKSNALVKTTIHSVDVPLLYGYKFVDVYPYGMAFFVGPKVAYTWDKYTKCEYTGFHQQGIQESIRPFNFSAVIGLAVNVSNIFFDFRYEMGLHNMSEGVDFNRGATEAPYNEQEIIIKRRRNVMSFSLGVIF